MAEPELVESCQAFEQIGDQGRLSSASANLTRLLYMQGRFGDADRYSRIAESAASEDDIEPQIFWRGTRAKLVARAGDARLAEQLSNTAVMLARETDFVLHHGAALSDRAEVMTLLDRPDLAARDLEELIAAYERKGIRLSLVEARNRLQALVADQVG
jgi:hypothetical protein